MKDPSGEILKAYYDVLNGNISYSGVDIFIGTKIPSDEKKYVYLYIDSIVDKSPGDSSVFEVLVAMDIITRMDLNSGDESIANSITDQVLQLVSDNSNFTYTNFTSLYSRLYSIERNSENTDTDYIASRKLKIKNFIQQKS